MCTTDLQAGNGRVASLAARRESAKALAGSYMAGEKGPKEALLEERPPQPPRQ